MVSDRAEKMLREWIRDEGMELKENESIEDWLREYFMSSPVFEKRLQEWVDGYRIHGSEQVLSSQPLSALQMNVAYFAELKRAVDYLSGLLAEKETEC